MRTVALFASAAVAATVLVAPPAQASSCPAPGGATLPAHTAGEDHTFDFRGRGWGHGIGMSQYGAKGAALLGCTYNDILTTYYTDVAVSSGTVPTNLRVGLFPSAPASANPTMPTRIDVENLASEPLTWLVDGQEAATQPAAAAWYVVTAGAGIELHGGATPVVVADGQRLTTSLAGARTVRIKQKTKWNVSDGIRYRWGTLDLARSGSGIEAVVAFTNVDTYLYGLAEMPPSFPAEALKAQSVAARSYATIGARSLKANCSCHIYDSVYDQAYAGLDNESTNWNAAVNATSGLLLHHGGKVVTGHYAASHGGHSEAAGFVWPTDIAHEQPVDDSAWNAAASDPRLTWTVEFTPLQLGQKVGVGRAVKVEKPDPIGVSGRIGDGGLRIVGTEGEVTLTDNEVRSVLGMRSTLFTVVAPTYLAPTGVPLVGDWDGDGTDTVGWWEDGYIRLRNDVTDRDRDVIFWFGAAGDIPVAGDWNGDGVDTIGVFRSGTWYLLNSHRSGRADLAFHYGRAGHTPIVGDWNGNGRDGIGVHGGRHFHLRNTLTTGTAQASFAYAWYGAAPLVGDWDGDGRDTVGVRAGSDVWLRNGVGSGPADLTYRYAPAGFAMLTGDLDGNGTDTLVGAYDDVFYARHSHSGGHAHLVVEP